MNELEIPEFDKGDIVKDKFGNLFEVYDKVFSERFNRNAPGYDKTGYRLKLIGNSTSSSVRMAGNVAGFYNTGEVLWIYNTKEDAELEEIRVTEDHLFATELELYDEFDHYDNSAKPAKAEISKRYPSIEDLQKISEENDLGNLLDQAYKILKEQASFGERAANLNFEKFKRCIPHFEREGFEITEHGTLIEVRW